MNDPQGFDLDTFFDLARVSGLALSPDGRLLVTAVARRSPDGRRFVSALWAVDPTGESAPRQLTRSSAGESHAAFLPDGSLLFTSTRPDPDAGPADSSGPDAERSRLWLLPPHGGEARVIAAPPGGVGAVATAKDSPYLVFTTDLAPGAETFESDAARVKDRADAHVTAQLYERYPIRVWDHYRAFREAHLFAAEVRPGHNGHDGQVGLVGTPRDLTPDPDGALDAGETFDVDLSADGMTAVLSWYRPIPDGDVGCDLALIDTATGERTKLATSSPGEPAVDYSSPALSPDGRYVACIAQPLGSPDAAIDTQLLVIDRRTGEQRQLDTDFDNWPTSPVWTPDGSAILFVADEDGHRPVFRVEVASGTITRLTADGCYSDVCVAVDGSAIYALRSNLSTPQTIVRLDPSAADQKHTTLPTPGRPIDVSPPGRVESFTTPASDGVEIQSWLVLPNGASADSPAPLVVWIHGGPLGAWGDWHWRWNPHVLAERGYAVLLPNPALSTGFGQDFIQRGWGRWGEEPYTDVMAATEAAAARDDVDSDRMAAMGGSFGGYMANWVAGQTDRFRCIVTHASLWALDQFHGTTDLGVWWEHEFGNPYEDPSRYLENSPHRHIANIRTPMLVIHGELDHRVPVGEALRLWTDLQRHGVEAKFLYFPDENHWILKPNNAKVWYETVLAYLDHYLLDKPWKRPDLL